MVWASSPYGNTGAKNAPKVDIVDWGVAVDIQLNDGIRTVDRTVDRTVAAVEGCTAALDHALGGVPRPLYCDAWPREDVLGALHGHRWVGEGCPCRRGASLTHPIWRCLVFCLSFGCLVGGGLHRPHAFRAWGEATGLLRSFRVWVDRRLIMPVNWSLLLPRWTGVCSFLPRCGAITPFHGTTRPSVRT